MNLRKTKSTSLKLRKTTSTSLNLRVFSKTHQSSLNLKGGSTAFPKPFFSWKRLATLGNMKANFHCAHLHNLSPQGTRDVPTALSIVFTTPSVPLIGDRNGAQTASLYGWRTIRGLRQQQSCGFLCGDKPAFTQGFAKGLLARCFFRKTTSASLNLKSLSKTHQSSLKP